MSLSRILIVDDEPRMIRSVERVLCQDYKIATTRSSREAITIANGFKPDLAILDVQMPELDGFDLAEQLRAIDPEVDVIFMTGSIHELDSKLIRAVRKDAFYFLQKPFDRELLLALVDRCLKLKRLDRENRRHLHRLEKELAEARAFQQGLLPPESGKIGRVSVFARYIPWRGLTPTSEFPKQTRKGRSPSRHFTIETSVSFSCAPCRSCLGWSSPRRPACFLL